MNTLLPMAIPKRYDGRGYVYFIRYHHLRNCYKIGSTHNLISRLSSLGGRFADIELISYGYAHDRFFAEKHLQDMFYEYCNNRRANVAVRERTGFNFQYAGDITSTEYFIFKPSEAQNVILAMKLVMPSVNLGIEHPFYCHKWHHPSLEPSDERQHYFDFENHRYIKYPTKFENGYPVYQYSDFEVSV